MSEFTDEEMRRRNQNKVARSELMAGLTPDAFEVYLEMSAMYLDDLDKLSVTRPRIQKLMDRQTPRDQTLLYKLDNLLRDDHEMVEAKVRRYERELDDEFAELERGARGNGGNTKWFENLLFTAVVAAGVWWIFGPSAALWVGGVLLVITIIVNSFGTGNQRSASTAVRPSTRHIPQAVKIAVSTRDRGRCVKCGRTEDLQFDHVIPFSQGGSNTETNIQLLCGPCNRLKGNRYVG